MTWLLEIGHENRVTLKPQTVWSFAGSKQDLSNGGSSIDVEDLPEGALIRLQRAAELKLNVEA